MTLNRNKNEYFALNPNNKNEVVKFEDNPPLTMSPKATYLGGSLQANGASTPELESIVAKAHIFGQLKPLWKDAACSSKWN